MYTILLNKFKKILITDVMNSIHINKDDMLTIDDKFVRMTTYKIKKAIFDIFNYIKQFKINNNLGN